MPKTLTLKALLSILLFSYLVFLGQYGQPPVHYFADGVTIRDTGLVWSSLTWDMSDEKYFLPRVVMYFDDIAETSSYTGELGAINSYNAANELKKIDRIPQLAEELSLHWRKWIMLGKRFYYWHDFSHSRYSDYVAEPKDDLPLT